MNTSDWISIGAGAFTAIGSGFSGWAVLYARGSARSARRSADEAARISTIETGRWHHELAPEVSDEIVAELETNAQGNGSLFGDITITGSKAFRVDAEGLFAQSTGSTPISLPLILEPGTHRLHIEHWAPGKEQASIKAVRFKFWPPVDGDATEVWSCPCGRPTAEAASQGGHWVRTIPVNYEHRRPRTRILGA